MHADLEQRDLRKPPSGGRRAAQVGGSEHVAWIYLALPLILLNPFVVFLRFHQYDLLQPESLLSMAIVAGLAVALAAVAHVKPQALQYPVLVLALTLFADVTWTEQQQLELLQALALPQGLIDALRLMMFPLMLVAISVITSLVRAKLSFIVTIVFGVMLGSSLILPQSSGVQQAGAAMSAPAPALRRDLPTVVHIVLDEQIGIESLPQEMESGRALRADLEAFYLERGFALFGRAFSHYYMTADSIPNMLNGAARNWRNAYVRNTGEGNRITLRENAWFDRLAEQGYRIKVFQTDYLDFCATGQVQAADCVTFPAYALNRLMAVELGVKDKSVLLFENFLREGFLIQIAARLFGQEADALDPGERPLAHWHWRPRPLTSLSAMPLIDRLNVELRTAEPGTVYFAHLLLPHHAMIYDRDCRTAANLADWMNNTDALLEQSLIRNSLAMRRARYDRYFEQVRCTHLKLAEALSALRAAGRFEDATIIVHGDHGSRLSQREPLSALAGELTDDDIRDNYATHFALRSPGVAPGYRQDSRSIQALFAAYLLDRPLIDETQDVYLNQPPDGTGETLQSRPMVEAAPGTR